MKRVILLTLPLAALAACNQAADGTTNTAMNDTAMVPESENMAAMNDMGSANMAMPAVATPEYLAQAGAGDMFEIESSRAVLQSTQNADVRKFAQMMIDQHQQSTAKVKAAAKEAGQTVPPPKLMPNQQSMLDEIKAASGTQRDQVYMRHQATAHQEALALHQGYASSGDSAPLKRVAGEIAPIVQQHIAELGRINA